MSLVFENEDQVLYNGTMGIIRFLGTDSYEFAYPNMNVSGKAVYNRKEHIIKNKKAWFDRQWSFEPNGIESAVSSEKFPYKTEHLPKFGQMFLLHFSAFVC